MANQLNNVYATINNVTNAETTKDLSTTDPKRHAILLLNESDTPRKMNLPMNKMVKMYVDKPTDY